MASCIRQVARLGPAGAFGQKVTVWGFALLQISTERVQKNSRFLPLDYSGNRNSLFKCSRWSYKKSGIYQILGIVFFAWAIVPAIVVLFFSPIPDIDAVSVQNEGMLLALIFFVIGVGCFFQSMRDHVEATVYANGIIYIQMRDTILSAEAAGTEAIRVELAQNRGYSTDWSVGVE